MASVATPVLDLSSLSLYKLKKNSISSLSNQNERRRDVLARQKEKREEQISQLRFSNINNQSVQEDKSQWPPRQQRKNTAPPCPIGMMLAEWLFSAPEDISSWFVIPCPLGQRCLVVVQSHRTLVYGKYGNVIWTMYTKLPKHTILYCIYDNRSSIYHILDIIMWNGQDYSTQIECQCRFFMLLSLTGDSRLSEQFQILPRMKIEDKEDLIEAEDGYLFYHSLGFYESGYSPLVCWLKPFMIEEILGIQLSYPIIKPNEYTTAQAYMFEEQSNRKSPKKKNKKKEEEEEENEEQIMSIDQ
jgi:snurportin-1